MADKKPANCLGDKLSFVQHAKPLTVKLGDVTITGESRQFSTGGCGWNIAQKVTITLPSGETATVQFNGNVSVIGSKSWPSVKPLPKEAAA